MFTARTQSPRKSSDLAAASTNVLPIYSASGRFGSLHALAQEQSVPVTRTPQNGTVGVPVQDEINLFEITADVMDLVPAEVLRDYGLTLRERAASRITHAVRQYLDDVEVSFWLTMLNRAVFEDDEVMLQIYRKAIQEKIDSLRSDTLQG